MNYSGLEEEKIDKAVARLPGGVGVKGTEKQED